MKIGAMMLPMCCALVLWGGSQVQARNYDGLPPGKKFFKTVREKHSTTNKGMQIINNAPVPAGIPDFRVGQRVKFSIGTRGKLRVGGKSIAFQSANSAQNAYANPPTPSTPIGDMAFVEKNARKRPTTVILGFSRTRNGSFTTVGYMLR